MDSYQPADDFIRVATATPEVAIGNVEVNVERILALYAQATSANVSLVVFPELCITGYTIQDLVTQPALLAQAKKGLVDIARATKLEDTAIVVGLPYQLGNGIYNCAAFISNGVVRGLVPKQHLPTYNEFYEKRWYQSWTHQPNTETVIGDAPVPFGHQQLFAIGTQYIGIEICEDLWVPEQPSIALAANGATIIVNPSASPETVAKAQYRRSLVAGTAARNGVGYIYVSAGETESTAEIVMSGHALINELGTSIAERAPFSKPQPLMVADIDTQHIMYDRTKNTNFPNYHAMTYVQSHVAPMQKDLIRAIDPHPFTPTSVDATERLDTILNIQATGLATRLRTAHIDKVILGLSGGLDSTLALIAAAQAADILGVTPRDLIHTLTMPGVASSDRTQNNAARLAEALGIPNEEIAIAALSQAQLDALQHSGEQDITYENTQARIRQALVFNKANQLNGLALGTGDLSEIALGWCTYNGDHMSHYNVNASIPKTLVKMLVEHAALRLPKTALKIIQDILATPVSPELTGDGITISQETEDIVGPYELHDFFLYHFLRWAEPIAKIRFLATKAFEGTYTADEISQWLQLFTKRFYQNQWKRQAMPDGAKVGLSLSPKGDWRMPPEAQVVY